VIDRVVACTVLSGDVTHHVGIMDPSGDCHTSVTCHISWDHRTPDTSEHTPHQPQPDRLV